MTDLNSLEQVVVLPYGYVLHTFASLPSTMDKAHVLAAEGCPHGTIILADQQTQGRGRRGATWISLEGNLNLSVVIKIPEISKNLAALSFIFCIAVGHALVPFINNHTSLGYKWPNDIILQDHKVGGILLEVCQEGTCSTDKALIVGVGLNLKKKPSDVRFPATSLYEQGIEVDKYEFLSLLCTELFELLSVWQQESFAPIQRIWRSRMWGLGCAVVVRRGQESITGIVRGIDEMGALVVEDHKHCKHSITAADILWKGSQNGNKKRLD